MKSKWLFLLLWMCVIVRPEAWGQEVKSANTVAEEWIQVSSSSATVLQWFEWIEKSTGIVLSYNPAQIPVDKSNNYFSLFVGRILINEKNQLQMFFYLCFIIRRLMGCGDFFSKKMIFRIGVLPKNCVMKTKPPGRVKQQRIKRKTF